MSANSFAGMFMDCGLEPGNPEHRAATVQGDVIRLIIYRSSPKMYTRNKEKKNCTKVAVLRHFT